MLVSKNNWTSYGIQKSRLTDISFRRGSVATDYEN